MQPLSTKDNPMQGTINLQPTPPTLAADNLNELVKVWLADCASRLPAYTVDGYKHKVFYFTWWWAMVGPGKEWQLRQSDFQEFVTYLEGVKVGKGDRPMSYNTQKDVVRRLKQLFKWAYLNHYVPFDWAAVIPNPVGSAPLRKLAPVEALRKLMEAAQGFSRLRDRALLAVLIGTGVRRAEASSINIEDVTLDADGSGVIRVSAKRVKGREIHQRLVAFDKYAGKHLLAWLDAYGVTSGPLFPAQHSDRERLSNVGIYKVVKGLIVDAGLTEQIQGPHDLRRTFATIMARYRRGEGNGQLLSKQLGHASYRMTAHYVLPDIEDVREVLFSPFELMEGNR